MSDLDYIQRDIAEVQQVIQSKLDLVAKYPERKSVLASISSLRKRQKILEQEFLAKSEELRLQVCSYRIFCDLGEDVSRNLTVFPKVLSLFQEAYMLSVEATRHGPKSRNRIHDDVLRSSVLSAGYSFAGSMGIVLTVPKKKQKILFDEGSDHRRAVNRLFNLLHAKSEEAIKEACEKMGLALIRCVMKYAVVHRENQIGSDIDWRDGSTTTDSIFLQPKDFEMLCDVIESTTEIEEEDMFITGMLTATDTSRKTFKMLTDDDEIITGEYHAQIDENHTVTIPGRYRAEIKCERVIRFSTGEVVVKYFIEDLEPVDDEI